MRICLAPLIALTLCSTAFAAEPHGEWLVEGGAAQIRIEHCGDQLWGFVSWEKVPGVDHNNPDSSKRDRPTLGMPVLLGMTPAQANRWDGEVYNAEDGRTYTSHISLRGDDVLRVEGCVLGFLCGGQNWTRAKGPAVATANGQRSARSAYASAQSAQELCSSVGAGAAAPEPLQQAPGRTRRPDVR
jgi:uncharacterized protein (DUF2147 family)